MFDEFALGDIFDQPDRVRDYLRLSIGHRDIEVFVVFFLSARNHVLSVKELFQGTLSETRVYPREVVRQSLLNNASAVIVAHNHPAGGIEPSLADIRLTEALKASLEMVDIKLLDHFIVTSQQSLSFCERGLL